MSTPASNAVKGEWPYELPRDEALALIKRGAEIGHKVMVTEVWARHILDCTCGDPWDVRCSNEIIATKRGLRHLLEVIPPHQRPEGMQP